MDDKDGRESAAVEDMREEDEDVLENIDAPAKKVCWWSDANEASSKYFICGGWMAGGAGVFRDLVTFFFRSEEKEEEEPYL